MKIDESNRFEPLNIRLLLVILTMSLVYDLKPLSFEWNYFCNATKSVLPKIIKILHFRKPDRKMREFGQFVSPEFYQNITADETHDQH